MKKHHLILGSQSPRRKELLGFLGIPFKVIAPNIEERSTFNSPIEIARHLSQQKAQHLHSKMLDHDHLILSADTLVTLNGKIYGKPKDRLEAKEFLRELSGNTHQVVTGVTLKSSQYERIFHVQSEVTFAPWKEEMINHYLDCNESMDKAGAYGIQGPSLTFITHLNGSYSNVVGLPLAELISEMELMFGTNRWRDCFVL